MIFSGFLDLPWWGYLIAALALTQITIASVTIYLHRCQAHRALELHPLVSHFFRFWAAGVINGVGHFFGYRNWDTPAPDASRNIVPWGIIIGGEELHNNHHAFASSARFSSKWYEFDIGWMYIRILEAFGLANVKK